jgi:hypothetical protein
MDANNPMEGYTEVNEGANVNTKVMNCAWSISPITQQVKISFDVSSSGT